MPKIAGVELSDEAAECIQAACGADAAEEVEADVDRLARGESRKALIEHCLDGAEPEYRQGWRDYVDAVAAAADLRGEIES